MNTVTRTVGGGFGGAATASILAATVGASGYPTAHAYTAAFLLCAGALVVGVVAGLCDPAAAAGGGVRPAPGGRPDRVGGLGRSHAGVTESVTRHEPGKRADCRRRVDREVSRPSGGSPRRDRRGSSNLRRRSHPGRRSVECVRRLARRGVQADRRSEARPPALAFRASDPTTTVVVYGYGAPLGFWLLKAHGHHDVRMLMGSRDQWAEAGNEWSTDPAPVESADARVAEDAGSFASRRWSSRQSATPERCCSTCDLARVHGRAVWPSGATADAGRAAHLPGAWAFRSTRCTPTTGRSATETDVAPHLRRGGYHQRQDRDHLRARSAIARARPGSR